MYALRIWSSEGSLQMLSNVRHSGSRFTELFPRRDPRFLSMDKTSIPSSRSIENVGIF